jgi:hypothetical protein
MFNFILLPPSMEAKVLIERWRCNYNRIRLHGSLNYRPPAPEAKTFGFRLQDYISWNKENTVTSPLNETSL